MTAYSIEVDLPKPPKRFRFAPKPDITAWELASVLAALGLESNWDDAENESISRHWEEVPVGK